MFLQTLNPVEKRALVDVAIYIANLESKKDFKRNPFLIIDYYKQQMDIPLYDGGELFINEAIAYFDSEKSKKVAFMALSLMIYTEGIFSINMWSVLRILGDRWSIPIEKQNDVFENVKNYYNSYKFGLNFVFDI